MLKTAKSTELLGGVDDVVFRCQEDDVLGGKKRNFADEQEFEIAVVTELLPHRTVRAAICEEPNGHIQAATVCALARLTTTTIRTSRLPGLARLVEFIHAVAPQSLPQARKGFGVHAEV